MTKSKRMLLIGFTLALLVTIGLLYKTNYITKTKEVIASTKEEKVYNSAISMMYETSAGSGEYTETSESSWPTDGYTFNSTLSKCDNGGTLTWDDTNKKVLMSTNASDKCYVYFDIPPTIENICAGQNMASCIKENYQLDSSILLHNASLTNGANDGSYRYSGASASVNNYVCFGSDAATCPTDNLYRIIGVFGDQIKLIKSDYATDTILEINGSYAGNSTPSSTYKGELTTKYNYYWKSSATSNTWADSDLNKTNLNTNFLNNIGSNWSNKIATTIWKVGGNIYQKIFNVQASTSYQNEIVSPAESTTYNARIGLMYASDYGFAASQSNWTTTLNSYNSSTVTANNWMYMGESEWTISRSSDDPDSALFPFGAGLLGSNGGVFHDTVADYNVAVRPVFYLNSNIILVSGSGTAVDPYRISLPDNIITFKISNVEYIAEDGMTWEQWVNSDYNFDEFQINGYVIGNKTATACLRSVTSSDKIVANTNYVGDPAACGSSGN